MSSQFQLYGVICNEEMRCFEAPVASSSRCHCQISFKLVDWAGTFRFSSVPAVQMLEWVVLKPYPRIVVWSQAYASLHTCCVTKSWVVQKTGVYGSRTDLASAGTAPPEVQVLGTAKNRKAGPLICYSRLAQLSDKHNSDKARLKNKGQERGKRKRRLCDHLILFSLPPILTIFQLKAVTCIHRSSLT